MIQWKSIVFDPINKNDHKLTNALLRLIEDDRTGLTIDKELAKNVIESFVALGIENTQKGPTVSSLNVYKQEFDEPFLQATVELYRKEARRRAIRC